MSVQRSQPSIERGQTAGYVVQISAQNGTAPDVTVRLSAQPGTVTPKFSSGCAKGDGAASCALASVTDKQAVSLDASIAVASTAASVTAVQLTATASVTTTSTWSPPAATETTEIKAASAPAPASASATHPAAGAPVDITSLSTLPLGPIPDLNDAASVLIGAGSAAGLFPAIKPSPGSGTGPPAQAQPGQRDTRPVSGGSPAAAASPAFTAQAAGLIAVGLAIMLTVTRLAARRRRSRLSGPRS